MYKQTHMCSVFLGICFTAKSNRSSGGNDHVTSSWLTDNSLGNGDVKPFTTAEMSFWEDKLQTILKPLMHSEEHKTMVRYGLKSLRNKMTAAFVISNTLVFALFFVLEVGSLKQTTTVHFM